MKEASRLFSASLFFFPKSEKGDLGLDESLAREPGHPIKGCNEL